MLLLLDVALLLLDVAFCLLAVAVLLHHKPIISIIGCWWTCYICWHAVVLLWEIRIWIMLVVCVWMLPIHVNSCYHVSGLVSRMHGCIDGSTHRCIDCGFIPISICLYIALLLFFRTAILEPHLKKRVKVE